MKRWCFNCKMTNGLSDSVWLFVKEKEDRSEEGPEAHPFKRVAGWNFQEINAFGAKTAGFLYARLLYFHSTHASKRFLGLEMGQRSWLHRILGILPLCSANHISRSLPFKIYGCQVFLIEDIRKGKASVFTCFELLSSWWLIRIVEIFHA